MTDYHPPVNAEREVGDGTPRRSTGCRDPRPAPSIPAERAITDSSLPDIDSMRSSKQYTVLYERPMKKRVRGP